LTFASSTFFNRYRLSKLGTGNALLKVEGGSMHYWFNDGHMFWMAISWLVGVGLFLMLIALLAMGSRDRESIKDSPEDILRRRYAAGDIDTEQYERRLSELRKTKSAA
jgi:putative membrane protein